MVRATIPTMLALAAIAAAGSAARAADAPSRWIAFVHDRDGRSYYDPASIRRVGTRVRVLVRATLDESPMSMIGREEVDCARQTRAHLSLQRLDAEGRVTRAVTIPPDRIEREPLFAGEPNEALYRLVCPKGRPLPPFGGPPIVMVPPPR